MAKEYIFPVEIVGKGANDFQYVVKIDGKFAYVKESYSIYLTDNSITYYGLFSHY